MDPTQRNDLKVFLSGHKPAFLHNWNKPKIWFYDDDDLNQLKSYPHWDGVHAHLPDQTLYFQTRAGRDNFLSAVIDVQPNDPNYHRLLGGVLGYPTYAAKFYANWLKGKKTDTEKAGISFSGIGFASDIADIIENIEELWERYPASLFDVPVLVSYSPTKTTYEIPFLKTKILYQVQEEIYNEYKKHQR